MERNKFIRLTEITTAHPETKSERTPIVLNIQNMTFIAPHENFGTLIGLLNDREPIHVSDNFEDILKTFPEDLFYY